VQENDVSVFGVMDDFVAQGFPAVMARVALLWGITRRPDETVTQFQGTIRARIDEDALFESSFTVDFGDQLSTRVMLNFHGFGFPRAGTVRVICAIEGLTAEFAVEARLPAGGPSVTAAGPSGAFLVP